MTTTAFWPPQRLHTPPAAADAVKFIDRLYERLYEAVGALLGPRDAFSAEVMARAATKVAGRGDLNLHGTTAGNHHGPLGA